MSNSVSYEYVNATLEKLRSTNSSRTIIPFASTHAPLISCDNKGQPMEVAPLGFGFASAGYTVRLTLDVDIDLNAYPDRQFSFTVPNDCKIENIYAYSGLWTDATLDASVELYPYITLYKARDSNLFQPINETYTTVQTPFTGLAQRTIVVPMFNANIGVELVAGDRILIVGHIKTSGSGNLAYSLYTYFSGGISLTF